MTDKHYIFPSLASSQHAYTLHTDWGALYDSARRSSRPLWDHAGRFETYGDGLTQHGIESVVCAEQMADYCASLASFLLTHQFSEEEVEAISYHWPEPPSREAIDFVLSVKHVPEKRAWYSLTERKVSRSESKRHDKRWEEVPEWADGSPGAAHALLGLDKGRTELLECYVRYEAVRERASATWGWGDSAATHLKVPGEHVDQAFAALRAAMMALREQRMARRQLDCYRHNTERRTEDAEVLAEVA